VVDGTWSEVAFALAEPGRKRRPVRLLQSDHPLLLVTWGLTRPRVILPRTAGDWPADRVRAVLGHELAHVERRDWAVQMVAELLRCIYWFNPLLWVACRRLRQESEQACDDAVLSMGVDARDYATHLLDVARALGHSHARRALFPAPAMARRSYLERRVRAMLNTRLNRTPLPRTAGIAIVVGLFAVTVPIAGVIASADLPRPAEAQPLVGATTRSRPADQVARADRRAPAFTSSRTTAQNAPAACSGTLMDATGRAMPGVPLALVNAGTGQRHEARSDEVGHFAISGLAAGEYQVEVQKAGFTRTQGRIVLAAGQELRQDVVAQIGSLMEMVVVQGGGPGTPDARPAVPRPLVLPGAPDADPCAQSVAGGCLTPPRKLVDANPVFPRAHAQDGASGTVVVEGRVGTDGFLKDLRVNDGADPDFAAATVEAVRQWQYAPVRLNGIPQECRLTVTVQFHSGSI
jgi:TonB family protein